MRGLSLSLFLSALTACGSVPAARAPVSTADGGEATDGGRSNNGCPSGYERAGDTCRDIDECANHPCDPNASCTNTDGAFFCTCHAKFEGDGFHCTPSTTPSTTHVGDECDPTKPDECASGLTCKTVSESGLGLCTKQCSTTAACGQGAVCVGGSCYEQCYPDMNTCKDPAFVCYAVRNPGGMPSGYCFESCVGRSADYCDNGYSCNESTGRCERFDCVQNSDCSQGQVCAVTPEGHICAPDCRLTMHCPVGLSCDTSTGECHPSRP